MFVFRFCHLVHIVHDYVDSNFVNMRVDSMRDHTNSRPFSANILWRSVSVLCVVRLFSCIAYICDVV